MDLLRAELERKKKQMKDTKLMAPDKKYFKRGDLAAQQTDEYWKKHKKFKTDAEENDSDESLQRKEAPSTSKAKAKKDDLMPSRKEVIRCLRERAQPIRLFGEDDREAYQRLKKLEMSTPDINKGYKNDFKAAMDKVDEEYLKELVQYQSEEVKEGAAVDVTIKDDGTTIEEINKLADGLTPESGDLALKHDLVLKFLKLVLNVWGEALNNRTEEEKHNFRGKLDSATHAQTVSYIKPLFKKLKRKGLSEDILDCLLEITLFLIDRHYIKANDAYLQMAIGNAPWPIGVTMVGIHARTGREKIFARNVAHVLNDETQRKYIQAVKRIMTQCQRFFPTDPSRSVDYEKL